MPNHSCPSLFRQETAGWQSGEQRSLLDHEEHASPWGLCWTDGHSQTQVLKGSLAGKKSRTKNKNRMCTLIPLAQHRKYSQQYHKNSDTSLLDL